MNNPMAETTLLQPLNEVALLVLGALIRVTGAGARRAPRKCKRYNANTQLLQSLKKVSQRAAISVGDCEIRILNNWRRKLPQISPGMRSRLSWVSSTATRPQRRARSRALPFHLRERLILKRYSDRPVASVRHRVCEAEAACWSLSRSESFPSPYARPRGPIGPRCRPNQTPIGLRSAQRQSSPARSLAGAHLGDAISKPVWTRSSAALSSPP